MTHKFRKAFAQRRQRLPQRKQRKVDFKNQMLKKYAQICSFKKNGVYFELQKVVAQFKLELREVDANLRAKGQQFIPLEKIAASIQF